MQAKYFAIICSCRYNWYKFLVQKITCSPISGLMFERKSLRQLLLKSNESKPITLAELIEFFWEKLTGIGLRIIFIILIWSCFWSFSGKENKQLQTSWFIYRYLAWIRIDQKKRNKKKDPQERMDHIRTHTLNINIFINKKYIIFSSNNLYPNASINHHHHHSLTFFFSLLRRFPGQSAHYVPYVQFPIQIVCVIVVTKPKIMKGGDDKKGLMANCSTSARGI